ncbi:MAG: hypothetical protein GX567_09850 [Clostridia bacterium]|nr:hypothetical protein [Clostridia bacterium]
MSMKTEAKERLLEEQRLQNGFLPYFSDAFFERFFRRKLIKIFWIMLFLFYAIPVAAKIIGWRSAAWLFTIYPILIVNLLLLTPISFYLKRFGYTFQPHGLVRNAWGTEKTFLYSDLSKAVQEKKVIMKTKGYLVPTGKGHILFPYEVGNARQQKHIFNCYRLLTEKLDCPMPKINKEIVGKLDQAYFYRRSFRRCKVVLFLLPFFILKLNSMGNTGISFYLTNGIMCFVQCFSIFRMFQSLIFGKRNEELLKEKLKSQEGVVLKFRFHALWDFILTVLIVLALNYFILRHIW